MPPPLVSIVMPCYNAERWLAAALDSVCAQTWPHCELIVVDDGSTDGSAAIARAYGERVRVVSQSNVGQSAACNHGLRLARGEFVKFFDADDLLSEDMVARQVRALEQSPGAVAYGEWARFRTAPEEAQFVPRPGWRTAPPIEWLVELWRNGQPMMQCGQFLIPRVLLARTGGWDERLSLINDFEFFTRVVLASNRVVFTPGARLYYRSAVSGSLSGRRSAPAFTSAFHSLTSGTDSLLQFEDSPRTRTAAAAILQSLIYDLYPQEPTLIAELEARVHRLGGSSIPADGGRLFRALSRVVGWKAARRVQLPYHDLRRRLAIIFKQATRQP